MIIKPYPYQETLINRLAASLQVNRSVCAQLPTGGGKTVVFAEIAHRFTQRSPTSVIIVVHRDELLKQTRKRLYDMHGIIAFPLVAGTKEIPHVKVYVCMVDTLKTRFHLFKNIPIGLLIYDETHIAIHNKVLDHFQTGYCLGFTATPIATNKKEPLIKRYSTIVTGPQIQELIQGGYLCQNITYAPKNSVDRAELKVKGDDFDFDVMSKKYSEPKFIINTVDAYKRWCNGEKTIVFNCNIAHSKLVHEEFLKQGFNSRHIDSTMPEQRKKDLDWFRETPNAIWNSVEMFTTGFDEPTVENVIVNLSTKSLVKWVQMCGRGGRIHPGKNMFKILDMGGNAITHGDWCNNRDWEDLFYNPPKKSLNGVSPCKDCPECEAILHASAATCMYCGYVFPKKEVGKEELMNQYLILTKNINIDEIISKHKEKKAHYAFFQIIEKHCTNVKLSGLIVDAEVFQFVLKQCINDCRNWCHINNKRMDTFYKDIIINALQKQLRYEHRILQAGGELKAG